LTLSFARSMEPERISAMYFGMTSSLDFSLLETAIASVSDEDRWERRAAQELAGELRVARIALCGALLDVGDEPATSMRVLRENRAAEFSDAAQLIGEISALPTITMPAVHVA